MSVENFIVIEDDVTLASQFESILKLHNFKVNVFHYAEEFLIQKNVSATTCIYLIDMKLPGIKGLEMVKLIRYKDKISPIFIISGGTVSDDITECLKHGADDYLLKPYNPDHLMLKILNAQTKTQLVLKDMLNVGIKLIPEANLVMREGLKIKLTTREFSIMEQLLKFPDEIHSREILASRMKDHEITDRTIDVHVSSLRKKVQKLNVSIETFRG